MNSKVVEVFGMSLFHKKMTICHIPNQFKKTTI